MENFETINSSGLEIIGKGATATVYRLDSERMLKAYRRQIPLNDIENERDVTLRMCEYDVKTPKCYGTVKTEEWYGNIYQMLTGGTLTEQLLSADEEGVIEWTTKYALLARSIHSKKAGRDWPDISDSFRQSVEESKDLLSVELYNGIRELFWHIPKADCILHGDLSTGNIMADRGELYLIDLATVGKGHPVIDLIVPYMVTIMWPEFSCMAQAMSPEDRVERKDWFEFLKRYSAKAISIDYGKIAWKQFLKVYFDLTSTEDDFADKITLLIRNCAMAKYSMGSYMKNIYSDELIREIIQFFGSRFSGYDEDEMRLLKDDKWHF